MSKKVNTTDVFKMFDALDPFGSSDLMNSDIASILEHIDTGSWILNAALSGSIKKGWANNKILQLAGEPGAGKTFVAIMMAKFAQKSGYSIVYIDTEGAVDRETLVNFGIDLGKNDDGEPMFRYTPVSESGTITSMLTTVIKDMKQKKLKKHTLPKIMFVLDSIGMLASDKEVDDSLKGKSTSDMGQRAKKIRSLFRQITSDLNVIGCPFIYTNHVGVNIGGYGDPVIISGGDGANYSASCTLCLSKAKLKDDKKDDKRQTGIIVTAKTFKSRFTQPKTIKFYITFDRPFNRYIGMQEYLSWENVGIAKGNLLTPAEYKKLKGADLEKVKVFTPKDSDEEMYFMPKETARKWIVEHLGEAIDTRDLFTARVFEPEIDRFDVLVRADFEFGSQETEDHINELLTEEDED